MRKEKAEKHEFRVLDPSITEAWSSASLGALKAADTRLSRGHWKQLNKRLLTQNGSVQISVHVFLDYEV